MAAVARRRRKQRSPLTIGLIALAIALVAVFLGFTKDIPFTKGFRVNAVFESSNGLRVNSPVRIAGVNVGKVKSVKAKEGTNQTLVVMEINDAGLPIHEDATAKIRPRIFLEGNFFVDLTPGHAVVAEARDRRHAEGHAHRDAGAARPGPDRAAERHAPGPARPARRARAVGLNSKPSAADDRDADPSARGETAARVVQRRLQGLARSRCAAAPRSTRRCSASSPSATSRGCSRAPRARAAR